MEGRGDATRQRNRDEDAGRSGGTAGGRQGSRTERNCGRSVFPGIDSSTDEAQEQRRRRLFALHRQALGTAFDGDGRWLRREEREPGLRERLCHAVPFLLGNQEERRRGNRIITRSTTSSCEFSPMSALQLLLRFRGELEAQTVDFLEQYVRARVDEFHDHIHSFWGMNWNQVCMGTFTLLAGGEYLDREPLVQAGRDNLMQARENLHVNGFSSEFVSATYTPIAMAGLQEIVHLVKDARAVDLARQVLERLWLEIACFWHAPTCALGGPQSRAYTPDSMGLPHQLHVMLYLALGRQAVPEELGGFFYEGKQYRRLLAYYDGERAASFFQHSIVAQAIPTYGVPSAARELLLEKSYPYHVSGTVELAEESVFEVRRDADNTLLRHRLSSLHWPCQRAVIRAHHTRDFAMGTSTGWWMDGGQTEQFFFVGRRAEPVRTWGDRTTVFARYLLNDHTMAGENDYPFTHSSGNAKNTRDEGHAFTAQHDDLVLYACQPKRFERRGITRLRLAVILPAPIAGLPDEIWYGEERLEDFTGEFSDVRTVFLRWGRTYLALHPLIAADWGRAAAVRVGMENEFGVISLINYEGPPRDFSEHEIVEALNGFAARAGSAATAEDFAAFRRSALAGTFIDQYYLFVRRLRYVESGLQLALEYSPGSLRYKQVSVNGCQELPHRLRGTGVELDRFPFTEREMDVEDAHSADWFQRISQRNREYYRLV